MRVLAAVWVSLHWLPSSALSTCICYVSVTIVKIFIKYILPIPNYLFYPVSICSVHDVAENVKMDTSDHHKDEPYLWWNI